MLWQGSSRFRCWSCCSVELHPWPALLVYLLVSSPCSCAGRHSRHSCEHTYGFAILEELDHLIGLQVPGIMLPVVTRTLEEHKTRLWPPCAKPSPFCPSIAPVVTSSFALKKVKVIHHHLCFADVLIDTPEVP